MTVFSWCRPMAQRFLNFIFVELAALGETAVLRERSASDKLRAFLIRR